MQWLQVEEAVRIFLSGKSLGGFVEKCSDYATAIGLLRQTLIILNGLMLAAFVCINSYLRALRFYGNVWSSVVMYDAMSTNVQV